MQRRSRHARHRPETVEYLLSSRGPGKNGSQPTSSTATPASDQPEPEASDDADEGAAVNGHVPATATTTRSELQRVIADARARTAAAEECIAAGEARLQDSIKLELARFRAAIAEKDRRHEQELADIRREARAQADRLVSGAEAMMRSADDRRALS